MKIGDRCFVHGYVDEIRKDTVIVRNKGGYFGTDPGEVIVVNNMAHPNWIPCSERLPDVGREIIFCDVDGDIFVGHRACEHWWSVDDKVKNVVAWMPLPAPYTEEKKYGTTPLEILNSTPKERQLWYWRKEMESCHRYMRVYPKGDERRKLWYERYVSAIRTYNELSGMNLKPQEGE